MKISIIGGGIAGLTSALCLHARGIACEVFESTRELRPGGFGINLQPHAVAVLQALGLLEELDEVAVKTQEMIHYDRYGNKICSIPRGVQAGSDLPQYSVHRGRLQNILLEAFHQRIGKDALRTGQRLVRFSERDAGVELRILDQRSGQEYDHMAEGIIAADGIRSAVRKQMYPTEGSPVWSGIHMWRGVAYIEPFLTGASMIVAGSNRRAKFVAYPLETVATADGLVMVNWVAEHRMQEGHSSEIASWSRKGRLEDVLPIFEGWSFGWLDIAGLIQKSESIYEYPMVDREPLPSWGSARVTLTGDAAHPVYPVGSNGGSQAILDAKWVAHELERSGDISAGFAAYQARRRPETTQLVQATRKMSAESILRIVEHRAPGGFENIDDILDKSEQAALMQCYSAISGRRMAGHHPSVLNYR